MNLPNFAEVDLFSAGINALYGVLVARQPSHDRDYTAAGLLIMAFFGGIGGVTRDVLLNEIPSPLKDPTYLFVCLVMGLLGAGDLSLRGLEGGAVPYQNAGLLQVFHAAVVCDFGST
jgi:hypothetical protein